jgi:hypothetical protein
MRIRCVVAVMAALTLGGCTDTPPPHAAAPKASHTVTPSPGARVTVAGVLVNYHGTADAAASGPVDIDMHDGYFEPTVIRGKPGQQLVLSVHNRAKAAGSFSTADWQVDMEVQPGSVSEAKFKLPPSGNVLFFSRNDKQRGMAGAFTVSGPTDKPGPTLHTR